MDSRKTVLAGAASPSESDMYDEKARASVAKLRPEAPIAFHTTALRDTHTPGCLQKWPFRSADSPAQPLHAYAKLEEGRVSLQLH